MMRFSTLVKNPADWMTGDIAAIDEIVSKLAETGLFEIHNLRFALDDNTKALDEARVSTALYQETGGRVAQLAGIAELRGHQQADACIHVGVVEYDDWRVAAQLQRHPLQPRRGEASQVLPDADGPRERNLANDVRGDQVLRYFAGHTEHQVQHARR